MGRNSHSCVPHLVTREWIQMCAASDRLGYTGQLNAAGGKGRTRDLAPQLHTEWAHVREVCN